MTQEEVIAKYGTPAVASGLLTLARYWAAEAQFQKHLRLRPNETNISLYLSGVVVTERSRLRRIDREIAQAFDIPYPEEQ